MKLKLTIALLLGLLLKAKVRLGVFSALGGLVALLNLLVVTALVVARCSSNGRSLLLWAEYLGGRAGSRSRFYPTEEVLRRQQKIIQNCNFFLTQQQASIDTVLALLVVCLLEASWQTTGPSHGKNGHGYGPVMPRGVLRWAETAVVARCLGRCLDWGTRHGMGHTPAFQEQVKMSDC